MKNLSIVIASLFFSVYSGVSAIEKVDINNAPLGDLVKIIHIGEKRGLELISLRPFSSLDDLARIKGIGLIRIEDIKKEGIAFVGPTQEGTVKLSENEKPATKTEAKTETAPLAATAENSSKTEADKLLKIDINNASAQELQLLVGIGVVLAQRIMDARPFCNLDELTKVNGIGAGTLENIKNQGLAWIDPNLVPPRTEEGDFFNKNSATASASLQQGQGKNFSFRFFPLLIAFILSVFSGIMILILKRKLRTFLS